MADENSKIANASKKAPRKVLKTLPDEAFTNQQLSLFQDLMANTSLEKELLSNAIDLWDSVPRFSITRRRQAELRMLGGFLPIMTLKFQYRKKLFAIDIHPARLKIMGEDGKPTGETIEYFPSVREELIEHALRKLAVDENSGFYDKANFRSGCRFTLHQLRTHLASNGHSFRYDELIEGLSILSLSSIEISGEGEQGNVSYAQSNYLPMLIRVSRKDLSLNPDAKWFIQFHPLITDSIQKLTYRQFNYNRLMQCRSQISRWLISQLVMKYTQAALTNSFEMRFSTIKRDSALLEGYAQMRQAVAALDLAWKELKSLGVLTSYKKAEQRGARSKLEDAIYTIYPTPEFVSEQKTANKRLINAVNKPPQPKPKIHQAIKQITLPSLEDDE